MARIAHARSSAPGASSPPISTQTRRRLFWGLHSAGWAGFVAFSTLASWMTGAGWAGLLPALAAGAVGFVLTAIFRYILRRHWNSCQLGRILVGCWLVGSLALGLSYSAVNTAQIDKPQFEADARLHVAVVLSRSFVMMSWLGLYAGIRYHLQMREQNQRMIAAATMAHEAQLRMLRSQINPHFLFNTLNAISTLVRERDNSGALSMVQKLATFFRNSLEAEPAHCLRLADEIAAIRLYMEIEQVRFGDRLAIRIDIAPDCEDALVPGMILLPLLENAIKHGVALRAGPAWVEIHAAHREDHLLLRIADSGPGFVARNSASIDPMVHTDGAADTANSDDRAEPPSASPGLGVGLHNTRARLAALYGDAATIRLGSGAAGGAEIAICLPLEFAPKPQETDDDH